MAKQDKQEKMIGGLSFEQLRGYRPPQAQHVPKVHREILKLQNQALTKKEDAHKSEDNDVRSKFFEEVMVLEKQVLELQSKLVSAQEKDAKMQEEHHLAWLESMWAQNKGSEVSSQVYDAQERELIQLENKVSLNNALSNMLNKRSPSTEMLEMMSQHAPQWNWEYASGVRLFAGAFDPANALPYHLLLTADERQEMHKEATALTFAATTSGSYEPASDTPRVVRARRALERVFNPGVMGFLGVQQDAVPAGAVNLTIARATDPADSEPEGRDEQAVTPAYGLTFRTHTVQLRAIQGLVEYTNESALLNPGQTDTIRRDLRAALMQAMEKTFLYGREVGYHEGLFYAANTAALTGGVTGVANRNAADIMGTTAEIDYTGATFNVDSALQMLSASISGGGGGEPVDDIHATNYGDLRILLPRQVANKVRAAKSTATDSNAWRVLEEWGVRLRSTAMIPNAVAAAPAVANINNGNGFHKAKVTYGFGVRGNEPQGVGNVSTFPAMEIVIDRGNKASSRTIQVYATSYSSIYAALRPERIFRYAYKMIA